MEFQIKPLMLGALILANAPLATMASGTHAGGHGQGDTSIGQTGKANY